MTHSEASAPCVACVAAAVAATAASTPSAASQRGLARLLRCMWCAAHCEHSDGGAALRCDTAQCTQANISAASIHDWLKLLVPRPIVDFGTARPASAAVRPCIAVSPDLFVIAMVRFRAAPRCRTGGGWGRCERRGGDRRAGAVLLLRTRTKLALPNLHSALPRVRPPRCCAPAAVSEELPHQAHLGQEAAPEPPAAAVDPLPHWQHHSVRTAAAAVAVAALAALLTPLPGVVLCCAAAFIALAPRRHAAQLQREAPPLAPHQAGPVSCLAKGDYRAACVCSGSWGCRCGARVGECTRVGTVRVVVRSARGGEEQKPHACFGCRARVRDGGHHGGRAGLPIPHPAGAWRQPRGRA